MKALDRILESARRQPMRIALCEAEDPRVLHAAARATGDRISHIVLVGNLTAIRAAAARAAVDLAGMTLVDPAAAASRDAYADVLHALRANHGMTADDARTAVLDPLCHANLMVRLGEADGSVAGAVHTTADVVRAAIRLIGVDPSFRLVSSFFLMMLCEPFHTMKGPLIFSDCALVVSPDAEQLADIAIAASDSAQTLLGETPRIEMLSFSTSGSAHHAAVDKVTDATRRVRERRPMLAIDGDVQLDAAIVAEIAQRKIVHSQVGGHANVLVFPNLEAGNIGYKLAEHIGRAKAVGPLLQGLRKPANDLSRGCNADDIYHVIAATAVQAQMAARRAASNEATRA